LDQTVGTHALAKLSLSYDYLQLSEEQKKITSEGGWHSYNSFSIGPYLRILVKP